MTSIKRIIHSKWIFVIGICLLTIGFGLADLDFYWQVRCGQSIITNHDFYSLNTVSWVDWDIGQYYDHEWFTNILFFLFMSIFGLKGIFVIKIVISSIVALAIVKFTRHYNKSLDGVNYVLLCIMLFLVSSLVFKVKAYTLSVVFVMYELILLDKYRQDENKNIKEYAPKLFLLVLLWNNMHSGSILLFFGIAGIYWLFALRERKSLLLGIISAITTLINPYGYKLILFDVLHNGNKVMKSLIMDWRAIDGKTTEGILGIIILFIVIVSMILNEKKDLTIYVLTFIMMFLTLQSERHIIYLMPLGIYHICNMKNVAQIKIKEYIVWLNLIVVTMVGTIFVKTFINPDYEKDYCMRTLDSELLEIVQENGYEGLFTSDDVLLAYGGKPFMIGAYPLNEGRTITTYFMNKYANPTYIENIIENYELNKFLINTTSTDIESMNYYSLLYDYLSNNDDYEMKYSDEYYSYFIRKEVN